MYMHKNDKNNLNEDWGSEQIVAGRDQGHLGVALVKEGRTDFPEEVKHVGSGGGLGAQDVHEASRESALELALTRVPCIRGRLVVHAAREGDDVGWNTRRTVLALEIVDIIGAVFQIRNGTAVAAVKDQDDLGGGVEKAEHGIHGVIQHDAACLVVTGNQALILTIGFIAGGVWDKATVAAVVDPDRFQFIRPGFQSEFVDVLDDAATGCLWAVDVICKHAAIKPTGGQVALHVADIVDATLEPAQLAVLVVQAEQEGTTAT